MQPECKALGSGGVPGPVAGYVCVLWSSPGPVEMQANLLLPGLSAEPGWSGLAGVGKAHRPGAGACLSTPRTSALLLSLWLLPSNSKQGHGHAGTSSVTQVGLCACGSRGLSQSWGLGRVEAGCMACSPWWCEDRGWSWGSLRGLLELEWGLGGPWPPSPNAVFLLLLLPPLRARPFSHSFSSSSIRHSISMPAMRNSATFKSFEDRVGTIKFPQ
ncbi:tumor protein D54 isoform X3 [Vulpes lagopus]|uniref:tumor protein D54 isoform X3 n=1 Tax=Vulpes lagopus TaxID=494514 RepID=UPI001BC8D94A|nr:tumor protein D54 isoform X3 [Vulpes lagopus]